MTNQSSPVGILGGGISGLSTAYALAQKGIHATVYEQQDEVGGAIKSIQNKGWLIEAGPNTLMVKSQAVWNLLDDIGLSNQMVEANQIAKKRFVVKAGEPVALPSSPGSFLATPLLSVGAKFRLFKEPFIPPSAKHDESIARFITRRLGRQPLDYGVNPFVSGIYAGDPKELSVKHTFSTLWQMEQKHGSIAKGFFKRDKSKTKAKRALVSFEKGNQMLPRALAQTLPVPVQTSSAITSVKSQENSWLVAGVSQEQSFENEHQCIISTLPTHSLPDIFGSQLFGELSELPYAPLSVVALGFESGQIKHSLDGFGMLIPEVEGFNTLGALFSSTLFSGRAPEGHQLLTCFIGGDRNPKMAGKPKDELQSVVLEELSNLLGISGDPVFTHHKFWERAIPQYKVGYDHYLSLMKEIEKQHTGLYLGGNYRGGVSVPDCISTGFETAQKAYTFLKSKGN